MSFKDSKPMVISYLTDLRLKLMNGEIKENTEVRGSHVAKIVLVRKWKSVLLI